MGIRELELLAKKIKIISLIVLISLPLAGCSVWNDDEYIDDKPWSQQEKWERNGIFLPQ